MSTHDKNLNIYKQFELYKSKKQMILSGSRRLPNSRLRSLLRPLLRGGLWLQRKLKGFSVEILNDRKTDIPKGKSVVFAVTHIGKYDVEIVDEQIKRQFFWWHRIL
ncbi:MAG: hypothetical protein NC223_02075 [Butyrivibrio sp.]|nr:hypothetical protein [Butyrivibrio sp.]